MSLEIREPKYEDDYRDSTCAKCGSHNIAATIAADYIKLFVCEDCLPEVRGEIQECMDRAAHRCDKCEHFVGSKYGHVLYGGMCELKHRDVCHDKSDCAEFELRQGDMKHEEAEQ